MFYQTDRTLDPRIQKYGCYFLCLAYFREKHLRYKWSAMELDTLWADAIKAGIISGDLNNDGDFDDGGELEILQPQQLCRLMGLPLKYVDGHFPLGDPETLAPDRFVITAWFNPATQYTHFVVGSKRPVEYDPIKWGSRTVREGEPKSCRVYKILV